MTRASTPSTTAIYADLTTQNRVQVPHTLSRVRNRGEHRLPAIFATNSLNNNGFNSIDIDSRSTTAELLRLSWQSICPITRSLRSSTSARSGAGRRPAYSFGGLGPVTMAAGDKLDKVLRHRARAACPAARASSSQFKGDSGRARCSANAPQPDDASAAAARLQKWTTSSSPRSPRIRASSACMLDRPVFATMERTGLTTGAALARQQTGCHGQGRWRRGHRLGITNWHDDLYRGHLRASCTSRTSPPTPTRVVSNARVRRLRPRHARRRHHRRHGYDSNGSTRASRRARSWSASRCSTAIGHGYISDVIAAIDYAIAVKAHLQHPRHQPLGRLRRLRVVLARPADAGRATRGRRRHRRRRGGRQPRAERSRARRSTGGITSPGNAPWVLTVGASSHRAPARAATTPSRDFSSRGPTWIDFAAKPDLVAPGVGIESLSDPHSTLYCALPELPARGGARPHVGTSRT